MTEDNPRHLNLLDPKTVSNLALEHRSGERADLPDLIRRYFGIRHFRLETKYNRTKAILEKLPLDDPGHIVAINTKLLRKIPKVLTIMKPLTDARNVFRVNLVRMRCQSPLVDGVADVITNRTEPEVVGVDTISYIALVAHAQPIWYRSFMNDVRQAMRAPLLAVWRRSNRDDAIPMSDVALPDPATIGLLELLKELFAGVVVHIPYPALPDGIKQGGITWARS